MLAPYKYLCGFYLRNDMKHGMTGTRIYNIWKDMIKRCYCKSRKDYSRYGGRGIIVCAEWQEFIPFYEWAMSNGYADNLTIDRKDNSKGYSPDNCRWITRKEQNLNKRNNHLLTYNGKTQTVAQWAEDLKCNDSTIRARISRGKMAKDRLLTRPISHPHYITFNGMTQTLKRWAEYTGISYTTLHKRIFKLHWNIERALTTK